ncbi:hypothetical protein Tco_1123231 [Tanacetum coccineum]|uniref:Uncharacterized protein n=1 Tax=Tanacetum coccineum TaxID=301880 RepID=A0ABQ5J3U1_9ASTR
MPTEMELTLEQTQQGVSYEVSVDLSGHEGYLKMVMEVPDSSWLKKIHSHMLIPYRQTQIHHESSSTCFKTSAALIPHYLSRSVEVFKVKEFQGKDATLKLFKSDGNGMSVRKSQVHKRPSYKMAKRLCLVMIQDTQDHNV